MQLAHSGNDGLVGVGIRYEWNVGSSCPNFCSATPIFSWSALVLGSIATEMTGSGKSIGFQQNLLVLVTDRIAGGDIFQSDDGCDIPGKYFLNFFTLYWRASSRDDQLAHDACLVELKT
jgi:hypothetical protein